MKQINLDEQTHIAAWELIPWYVNGTLDEADRRLVETHLLQCPVCNDEVDAQSRLRDAMKTSDGIRQRHAELAWAALDRRLDSSKDNRHPMIIGAALAAGFAGLALGFALNDPTSDGPAFTTLTGATQSPDDAGAPALRIRIAPGASEGEVIAVLQRAGLSDIGDLSDTGLIVAQVPAHIDAAALADQLMRDPSIAYVAGDF